MNSTKLDKDMEKVNIMQQHINLNILITHVSYQASAGSFIKLLRNSQRFSCHIIGCDSIPKGFSSGSMLVDKFYYIPDNLDENDYAEYIYNICIDEHIDLVISAEEEDLLIFKKIHLKQALYPYIPQENIFAIFRDKHLANLDVESQSFLTPKTIMNRKDFIESKQFTFIHRKRVSCCSRGIKILERSSISHEFKFFSDDYITQEFISGNNYTVDVLCDRNGAIKILVPRRSIAEKDGTTFKCLIENENSILDACQRFYSHYLIPGISNIQFIVKNGQAYFIELNPRAAATLIASSLASVNFLDLYISHFLLNEELPLYDELMHSIHWNSVVSRYYQETILYQEQNLGEYK